MFKEEIAEIAIRNANGSKPGEQGYISTFQGSVTQFLKGLGEEELLDLDNERAKWITETHPVNVQRKTAERMGHSYLQTVAETQYKEMGMRSVIWEFHENKAGVKLFQLLS